ncbi:MAG: hypothetical protein ACRET1_09885, partial [Burkholderiales bacterium]
MANILPPDERQDVSLFADEERSFIIPRMRMSRIILLNKPCGVICQFSPSGGKPTLKDHVPVPGVYPAGRLDT